MFEFTEKVRFSETDEKLRLTLPALLNYFQDCSLFHSESAGVGVEMMKEQHFAWVLSSWQVELGNMPRFGDDVIIGTFAYDFRGCRGMRDFYLKDINGKVLASADTHWALIDTEAMKPMRVSEDMAKAYAIEKDKKLSFPELSKRIQYGESPERSLELSFSKADCDMNHHVNNVRLISSALELCPIDSMPKRLRTEFKKQVFGGESVKADIYKDEKLFIVVLSDSEGSVCTVCEFTM